MGEARRLQVGGQRPLVNRVAKAVDQRHGGRTVPLRMQGLEPLVEAREVQGAHHAAVGSQTLRHLHHRAVEGIGPRDGEGEEVGAALVADAQQVAKALGDEEHRRLAAAFEQGVGAAGGGQAEGDRRQGRRGWRRRHPVGRQNRCFEVEGHRRRRVGPQAWERAVEVQMAVAGRPFDSARRTRPRDHLAAVEETIGQVRWRGPAHGLRPGGFEARPHGARRQDLEHVPATLRIQAHGVGKGATGVDPKAPDRCRGCAHDGREP